MYWKVNNIFVIFLLGLITRLAASKCAAFNLYAIKPKGDGFTVHASSDSFEKALVKTYSPRDKRVWGHKFLTSICQLYSDCYGSPATDMVYAYCYSSGLQYIKRGESPSVTAQKLEAYINGMPNDVALRPNCREPKVAVENTQDGSSTIIKASGLTGEYFSLALDNNANSGPTTTTKTADRSLRVHQLLHLMCREFARCLHTLKQGLVEHKCVNLGIKNIQESHVELMAMQLELYMKAVVRGDIII